MKKLAIGFILCLLATAAVSTTAVARTSPYIRFQFLCECCRQGVGNIPLELYENDTRIDAGMSNAAGYVFFDIPDNFIEYHNIEDFSVRSSAPVVEGLDISLRAFFRFTEMARNRLRPWEDSTWGAHVHPMMLIPPTQDFVLNYNYSFLIPVSALTDFGLLPLSLPLICEDEGVRVAVNGAFVRFSDQFPVIHEDMVLIPVRHIFERLGFEAYWDNDVRHALLIRETYGRTDTITIGLDSGVLVNGEYLPLAAAVQIKNNRVLLSVCTLAQVIDYAVFWDDETQTLHIAAGVEDGYVFIQGEPFPIDTTVLGLPSRGLTNVDIIVLRYMVNLRRLHLNDNNISDITPLENLWRLQHLNLRDNQISDIAPLPVTFLERLDLTNNPISTWVPVASMPWVWGRDNAFAWDVDGSAAENQSEGAYIVIQGQRISKTLTELYLHSWHLTDEDIVPLQYMKSLEFLVLNGNDIADLTPLTNLASLEVLQLRSNNIEDLSPLSGLTNLRELHLSLNQISDLSPLVSLTALETLWLGNNNVRDISPLANLISLETLYMNRNHISDLAPLESLTNLRVLWLGDNEISNISPLASLTLLWWLDLDNNHVSDLTPLKGLTDLRIVSLRNNPVVDLGPVAHVRDVEH
ncbi:MAG: leucine-rich repeat domain-containing protein [Defluviitaleaceae bacterium]|nr:leucine-rich repeat domain-containing protein [Defluviitaleaceae bacterium]